MRQVEAALEGTYVQKVRIVVSVAGGEGVLDDVDGYAVVESEARGFTAYGPVNSPKAD